MAKWTKPSGLEVETNDESATIAHCESIGWTRELPAEAYAPPVETEAPPVETEAPPVDAEPAVEYEPAAEDKPEPEPVAGNGRRRPAA